MPEIFVVYDPYKALGLLWFCENHYNRFAT